MIVKQMMEFGFGRRFHDLRYFEVDYLFYYFKYYDHVPSIHYPLEASSQHFVENHEFNVI